MLLMNTPVKSVGKRTLFVTPSKSENVHKRLDQKETPHKYHNIPYSVLFENAYSDSAGVQTVLTAALPAFDTSTCQVSVAMFIDRVKLFVIVLVTVDTSTCKHVYFRFHN